MIYWLSSIFFANSLFFAALAVSLFCSILKLMLDKSQDSLHFVCCMWVCSQYWTIVARIFPCKRLFHFSFRKNIIALSITVQLCLNHLEMFIPNSFMNLFCKQVREGLELGLWLDHEQFSRRLHSFLKLVLKMDHLNKTT